MENKNKPVCLFVNSRTGELLQCHFYTGISLLMGYLTKHISEYYFDYFSPDFKYYDLYHNSAPELYDMEYYNNFWLQEVTKKLKETGSLRYLCFFDVERESQFELASQFAISRNKPAGTKVVISCAAQFQDTAKKFFDYVFDLVPGELLLANLIKPGNYEYSLERMEFRNTDFYKKWEQPLMIMSRRRLCANKCLFCLFCNNDLLCRQLNIKDRGWLDRFANFAEDIAYYVQKTQIKRFLILDNALNLSLAGTKKFLNDLLKKAPGIDYSCHLLMENCDNELLVLLKQSGCSHITVGIDSGSARFSRFLHSKNKRLTVFRLVRRVLKLKRYGFFVATDIIFAYPYEPLQCFLQTLKLIRLLYRHRIDEVNWSQFSFGAQAEFGLRAKQYHLKPSAEGDEFSWTELLKDEAAVKKRGELYKKLIGAHIKELQKNTGAATSIEKLWTAKK